MNSNQNLYKSLSIDTDKAQPEYSITQYLSKGKYQLIVTAPFGRQIALIPLAPPVGFVFLPDQDPSTYTWNSFITVPKADNYSFLIRLDQPLDDTQLFIQFLYQGESTPPPIPPPSLPPTPPQLDPDAANQQRYRNMGYEIASDGSVVFYHVTVRRNRRTNIREVCAVCYNAWSVDIHDPTRTIMRLNDSTEHNSDWEYFRRGPFPTAQAAEDLASSFASQFFGDPTRYGLFKVGGETRSPYFA